MTGKPPQTTPRPINSPEIENDGFFTRFAREVEQVVNQAATATSTPVSNKPLADIIEGQLQFDQLATTYLKQWLRTNRPGWETNLSLLRNEFQKNKCLRWHWSDESFDLVHYLEFEPCDDVLGTELIRFLKIGKLRFEVLLHAYAPPLMTGRHYLEAAA